MTHSVYIPVARPYESFFSFFCNEWLVRTRPEWAIGLSSSFPEGKKKKKREKKGGMKKIERRKKRKNSKLLHYVYCTYKRMVTG